MSRQDLFENVKKISLKIGMRECGSVGKGKGGGMLRDTSSEGGGLR